MEVHGVIVIGAGPSGLAASACLARAGIDYVCLEREQSVGSTWRGHYERLHLHTTRDYSALPYQPWPKHVPTYPSRVEVVEYLEQYAAAFGIAPRFGTEVTRAYRDGDRWIVEAGAERFSSRALVIATGYNCVPKRPEWPGQSSFRGTIVHSSQYRNGRPWRGKRALVVGIGNSGGEIAIDLWECGARTSIAVRSPVHVMPRDLGGTPAQISGLLLSRLPVHVADRITLALLDQVMGDLSGYGLRRPAIGPMTQVVTQGRIPLIDVGTIALIKQGHLRVVPGIERFTETGIVFTDGCEESIDVVVLATGYHSGLSRFLENAADYVDDRGYPHKENGVATAQGLHFIGYRNPPIGQLNDISRQAPEIATEIKRNNSHG